MKCTFCLAKFENNEPYCPHCGQKNPLAIPGLAKAPLFEFMDEPSVKGASQPPRPAIPRATRPAYTVGQTQSNKNNEGTNSAKAGCFIAALVIFFIFIVLNIVSNLSMEFDMDVILTEDVLSDLEYYYDMGDYETMGDVLYAESDPSNMVYHKYYVTYDLYLKVNGWVITIPDPAMLHQEYLLQGSKIKEVQYESGFLLLQELSSYTALGSATDNKEAALAFIKEIRYIMTNTFLLTDEEIEEVLRTLTVGENYPFKELVTISMKRISSSIH